MAKYIELDELMKYPIRIDHCDMEHGKLDFVLGIESVLEYAEYLPTADVVEVVRCKDCKYHNKAPCPMRLSFNWTNDSDFCSYGERKENNND